MPLEKIEAELDFYQRLPHDRALSQQKCFPARKMALR